MDLLSSVTSLLNNKILNLTKFKAFADDKSNMHQVTKLVSAWKENIAEKGENAGYFSRNVLNYSVPSIVKTRVYVVNE